MLKVTRIKTNRFYGYWAAMVFCLLLTMETVARGNDIEMVVELMTNGKFYEAAEVAITVGGTEGFTLAARALAIHGYEIAPESDKEELFLRAINYAEKAVELDPSSSAASLEISHAMGRYAQTISVAEALSGGFAEKTKAAMDKAIRLDPTNFSAYLSVGSWHAEIVAAAGFMAKLLYGATEELSLSSYQRALDLNPNSGLVHFEYAVGLMRLDSENLDLATKHLEKAIGLPTTGVYGKIIQEKARKKLAQLLEE